MPSCWNSLRKIIEAYSSCCSIMHREKPQRGNKSPHWSLRIYFLCWLSDPRLVCVFMLLFICSVQAGVTRQSVSWCLCFYLLTGFPGEHMSLPAEVLPQLHHRSALSGQPEGQRGLWILCEGTSSAVPSVREETQRHRCPNRQTSGSVSPRPSRGRNVTICPLCNIRCHHAYVSVRSCIVFLVLDLTSLHTLFQHPSPPTVSPLF